MCKYCNDHENLSGKPTSYVRQLRHETWNGFGIRHGHGTCQEYLHVFAYEIKLRDVRHPTQWWEVDAGDDTEYFMSFSPKNLGIDGTICSAVKDEFEVYFSEKAKPPALEIVGWATTSFLETDRFYHTVSHLAIVSRAF